MKLVQIKDGKIEWLDGQLAFYCGCNELCRTEMGVIFGGGELNISDRNNKECKSIECGRCHKEYFIQQSSLTDCTGIVLKVYEVQ